jgi:hypothetical protein
MEVIDLFREEDTRDELGLGTIRDPLADLMFPGTSTIQTRARYFLFVPWIYQDLERRRTGGHELDDRLRKFQGKLRNALIEGGEETGVIGYRAGLHVQRLPSSVYWYGLRQWGILRFDGTESDLRRYIDLHYRRLDDHIEADGGEALGVPKSLWDPHLPPPPKDFLSICTLQLTPAEADYLSDRISTRFPGSLLEHLISSKQRIEDNVDFPWETPWNSRPSESLLEQLDHSRNFSELMHGGALLYNLLLAEEKVGGDHVEHYRDALRAWWDKLAVRRAELLTWDRAAFWDLVRSTGGRVPILTQQFVEGWVHLTLNHPDRAGLADNAEARRLVVERERWLKKGRARIGNPRALENWNGAAGSVQLNYRWSRPVRAMVNDILAPFIAKGANARPA